MWWEVKVSKREYFSCQDNFTLKYNSKQVQNVYLLKKLRHFENVGPTITKCLLSVAVDSKDCMGMLLFSFVDFMFI